MLWYAASPPRLSTKASRDGGNESTAEKTPRDPTVEGLQASPARGCALHGGLLRLGGEFGERFKVNS